MNPHIFREVDIRGVVAEDFPAADTLLLGGRALNNKARPKNARQRMLLGAFLAFLVLIGLENQIRMFPQLEAFRNDAHVQRLRETLRAEFQAFRHDRPGALDVRGESNGVRLSQICARLASARPRGLKLLDGPPGLGRLVGRGHPFLGGRARQTVWLLAPGLPGGSLEIKAIPQEDTP